MPGPYSNGEELALVPTDGSPPLTVHTVHHGFGRSVSKVAIAWGPGNRLRLSYLQQQPPLVATHASQHASLPMQQGGSDGKVMEIQVGSSSRSLEQREGEEEQEQEQEEAEKRRRAYESLTPFALLQSRKRSLFGEEGTGGILPSDWWENVLEYSHNISSILGPNNSRSISAAKTLNSVKGTSEPTVLKAVWDLLEVFYVDKNSLSWLPERLVDWLESYDRVLSSMEPISYFKLADFQIRLSNTLFPEDDEDYWDCIASAFAIGWLDVGVEILRMHGSYQHDQIDDRQTENGLVEAVAVLISKMPRLRPNLPPSALGTAFGFKPDFAKAWETWRKQVAKLDGSIFWAECNHEGTFSGLKKLLQVLLGNIDVLVAVTSHWIELLVAHFLFIRPFSMVSEGMLNLARKCTQLKPPSSNDQLVELILAVMGDNTEVVLAECSHLFDPWMLAHMLELLTAKSSHAQALLHEERDSLGGISLEELHRLVYAQLLSSHSLTWQLAPVYLASCPRNGLGLLETSLLMQPVTTQDRLALKVLEICRIYGLRGVAERIMRAVGVHHWKHGRKGLGIAWLQRAQDNKRLSSVVDQLLATVPLESGSPGDSFQQFEGLIELLGSDLPDFGGLSFFHRYRDFKLSLQNFRDARLEENNKQKLTVAGRKAVDSLTQLIKERATPQRFWLSLLHDSVELLECPEEILLTVAETNMLLLKLQDLHLAKLRGDMDSFSKPSQSLERVRLALAMNLGRAMLRE